MDLLKKVETLLNAKARSVLPQRGRRSILDEQEADVLAEAQDVFPNTRIARDFDNYQIKRGETTKIEK